jgi:hypothetical protein
MKPTIDYRSSRRSRRGATTVEFALMAAFYFVPMILGTFAVGFNLLRAMQAAQVTRDVSHMYGKGIDFTQTGYQNLIVSQIGEQLQMVGNITSTSGTANVTGGGQGEGVIILSTIQWAGPNTTSGANKNQYVVLSRIIIGNQTLYKTLYGSPTTISSTTGLVSNPYTDTNARAPMFGKLIPPNGMTDGQTAYLTETYFSAPGLEIPGLVQSMASYNFAVF